MSKCSLCQSCSNLDYDNSVGASWCQFECDERWELPEEYYEGETVTVCPYYSVEVDPEPDPEMLAWINGGWKVELRKKGLVIPE